MIVAICQGKPTRSMTVVDVGSVRTYIVLFKGHTKASQPTDVAPRWIAGICSSGPQTSLQFICTGHSLQGLQQQKGTVLTLSCYMHDKTERKVRNACCDSHPDVLLWG